MDDFRRPAPTRRDYTVPDRPARPPTSPIPPLPQPPVEEIHKSTSKNKFSKKSRFFKALLKLIILATIVAGAYFGWQYYKQNNGPIPKNIKESADYTIYYPASLPSGYSLQKDSVQYENGIVLYVLKKGNNTVNVSQQIIPLKAPDLSKIKDFSSLQTSSGTAAIGNNGGVATAILETPTTLVSITGSKGVQRASIGQIAQSMKSLN